MLSHLEFWILEAAFRSLLMAVAVWAGIRMMRVETVLAQKVAWVLVLLAAGTMPLVMRTPWLSLNNALRIPVRSLSANGSAVNAEHASQPPATQASNLIASKVGPGAAAAAVKPEHRTARAVSPTNRSFQRSRFIRPLRSVERDVYTVARMAGIDPQVKLAASALKPAAPVSAKPIPNAPVFWNWTRVKPILTALYLAVVAILLLRTLAGLSVAFRLWRRSAPIASFSRDTLPALGTRVLRARVSPDLATPVTIGSTVILPADYASWDQTKLRVVLAHEQSHVRQGDFYLQSLAALHLAVFWFSPLGWWLQRKISELGEALSDRAGLEQAKDPASYAQILLEFAAMPRTNPYAGALTGVAMARSSNLSSRIERILNARRFRLAFRGGRSHAVLAATLVPAALLAAVACIRIVPAVEAAQAQDQTSGGRLMGVVAPAPLAKQTPGPLAGAAPVGKDTVVGSISGQVSGEVSGEGPDQVMTMELGQAAPPPPAAAPAAPNPPSADVAPVEAPEPAPAPEANEDMAPVPPKPPKPGHHGRVYIHSDDDDDSFAIVRDGGNSTISINGHSKWELEKAREKYHSNFIWFEHEGKSYVITDPAIFAQSEAMFKGDPELDRQMAALDMQQAELNKKMELLEPEMRKAQLPGPEFEEQMKKLRQKLAALQADESVKLAESIAKETKDGGQATREAALQATQERLGELQEKIGDIQGQIGEIQGKIGERQGQIGEKQGELGEQMGRLGEQMGRIGEQQGRNAEEATRKMRSVFDQAIRDGKAKPVE